MLEVIFQNEDEGQTIVTEIDGMAVKKIDIRQFRLGTPLERNIVYALIRLFQKRDARVCTVHRELHSNQRDYNEFLASKYLAPEFAERMLQGQNPYFFGPPAVAVNWQSFYRIYLPFNSDGDTWRLIVVIPKERKIYICDPYCGDQLDEDGAAFIELCRRQVCAFFAEHTESSLDDWECDVYPHCYYTSLQNDFDGAIYIVWFLYLLAFELPLCFDEEQGKKARDKFAYWLLKGSLPM